jgi:hypothetical protein
MQLPISRFPANLRLADKLAGLEGGEALPVETDSASFESTRSVCP